MNEPKVMTGIDPDAAWLAGYQAGLASRSCPRCFHMHLDVMAEECPSCGCGLYTTEQVISLTSGAVSEYRLMLAHLWGATGSRAPDMPVRDLFNEDDPIRDDIARLTR